jgi:hypothetical protein
MKRHIEDWFVTLPAGSQRILLVSLCALFLAAMLAMIVCAVTLENHGHPVGAFFVFCLMLFCIWQAFGKEVK